jgi:predicted RNase H-like nuclease (RuvC/YqgF family)
VGQVIPEIVVYEENGVDASGMDYSKMTPLLVEAANAMRNEYLEEIAAIKKENQEFRKENREFKKENQEFKKENQELKTRLDKIERMLVSQSILQSQ